MVDTAYGPSRELAKGLLHRFGVTHTFYDPLIGDGIEELMQQSVYPNPTTGIVNLPQIENLTWQLFDAKGRMIAEGATEKQIDFRALRLAEQTYTLRLMSKDASTSVKLVYFDR